eukprot:GGOE01004135.1.p1 GENE.GGOE01004135.1~~GGOE01004135.1.p1  ORF type:complete len:1089 (+),score=194.83 GGOE01004135.1:159-3269(+)
MAAVGDWEDFARRHSDTFQFHGHGKESKLDLVAPGHGAVPDDPKSTWAASRARNTHKQTTPGTDKWQPSNHSETSGAVHGPNGSIGGTEISSSAAMARAQDALLRTIDGCSSFPISLTFLQQMMGKVDKEASLTLKQMGYGPHGPHSFRQFVQLSLQRFPKRLRGFSLVESGPMMMLMSGTKGQAKLPSASNSGAAAKWAPRTSHSPDTTTTDDSWNAPTEIGTSSSACGAATLPETESSSTSSPRPVTSPGKRASDAQHSEASFEKEPLSELVVKLVGLEAAMKLSGRCTTQSSECRCTVRGGGGGGNGLGDPSPLTGDQADSLTKSELDADTDSDALFAVCRTLCDVIADHPAFPVELKTLAWQLEQRCPGVRAILEENGFLHTCRGFADFTQFTLEYHSTEMHALELTVGDDGVWMVTRVATTPTVRSASPDCASSTSASPQPRTQPCPAIDSSSSTSSSALSARKEASFADPCRHIADPISLARASAELHALYRGCLLESPSPACRHLALGCMALGENHFNLVLASPHQTYIISTAAMGVEAVRDAFQSLLRCQQLHKVISDADVSVAIMCMGFQPVGLLDAQLACEFLTRNLHGTLRECLQLCKVPHPEETAGDAASMPRAALEVSALACCYGALTAKLGDQLEPILLASAQRAKLFADNRHSGPSRLAWFDSSRRCCLISIELFNVINHQNELAQMPVVEDNSGVQALLSLVPPPFQATALQLAAEVTSVVLDLGRRPEAFCGERHTFLLSSENMVVGPEHIVRVVTAAGMGSMENKAVIPGCLHRFRAIRSSQGHITGLTMRVVRPIIGLALMLSDVLLGMPDCSVLVLGEPQCGKTSVLREVACLLSKQMRHTIVVDTFNDIGGDGDWPHPSLGHARRMPVPAVSRQREVMEECLQNHRPGVMVVDEIGHEAEVEVAMLAKRRGVRLVAGAVSSLNQLLGDPQLSGLVGGVETCTSADGLPFQKRKAEPIFDCVVELRRGAPGDWVVIRPVAEAVDLLLQGKSHPACRRTSEPKSGLLWCTPLQQLPS